jgi:hypothetical protein
MEMASEFNILIELEKWTQRLRIPAIPDTYSRFNRTLSPDLSGHLVLIKPDTLSCAKRTVLSFLFFA